MFPYIDDTFIIAQTKEDCVKAVKLLCSELRKAGFTINIEKSTLEPTTKIKFLGFWLDSELMQVTLTEEKQIKLKTFANNLLAPPENKKIRRVASLLGLMTAYAQGLKYAKAHIKTLEIDKNRALVISKGNFEKFMKISEEGKEDINWWLNNIKGEARSIEITDSILEVTTDASLEGWGAHDTSRATGGRWPKEESEDHNNVLELKAIKLGLQSLVEPQYNQVTVYTDNTTALAYVRRMGGTRSPRANELVREIWHWAENRDLWLNICHIFGKLNVRADGKSRAFKDHREWSLSHKLF